MQFTNPQAVDDILEQLKPIISDKRIVDAGEAMLLLVACAVACGLDRKTDEALVNSIYADLVDTVRRAVKRAQAQ